MRNISSVLLQDSIKKRVLIGFAPVLLVLGLLAVINFYNSKTFFENFRSFSKVRNETVNFLSIEKDMQELQRNALVYSYIGYSGVLKKIEYLQKGLEAKFKRARIAAQNDQEINARFERVFVHYQNYKNGFSEVIKNRAVLKALKQKGFESLAKRSHVILKDLMSGFERDSNFKAAYLASKIKGALFDVDMSMRSFETTLDTSIINEIKLLVDAIHNDVTTLKLVLDRNKKENMLKLNEFLGLLDERQQVFLKIVDVNRIHLHLVNVVLAGKAAEIDKLSTELDVLTNQRAENLSMSISADIHRLQKESLLLAVLAVVVGFLCAWAIAVGLMRPVVAIANTLSQLAGGKLDTDIPGQDRRDEVGQMAKAANEFKNMAEHLEYQTIELEEFAYRTSHDLRSPLVSSIKLLSLSAKFIENGEQEKGMHAIGIAQESLKKLELLVRDILAIAQTKNAEEIEQDINVSEVINEAILKFEHMDFYERLDMQRNFECEEKISLKKSRFILVVENLISNAIKYQDVEKGNSFIRITTSLRKNDFLLTVEDNGLGIPQEQQGKLFVMFKRFHPKVSYGSGLGLYMMKKSADVMGGVISYEDSGQGSIFKLLLSVKQ